MSSFTTPLRVEPIDDKFWKILETFEYHVGDLDSGFLVRVPKGYTTDFATVPRFLWNIVPPWGTYGKACVVHDYLLDNGHQIIKADKVGERLSTVTRKKVDKIFLEAMEVLEVNYVLRYAMYAAVRVYSWYETKIK